MNPIFKIVIPVTFLLSSCSGTKESEKELPKAEISALLQDVYNEDQALRARAIKLDGVKDKDTLDQLWETMRVKDSINYIKVNEILEKYGWLGPEDVGEEASSALFLVIQHSSQAAQEKYLPVMREAVKQNKAQAWDLALLEDRVALKQGKRQIYGSQIVTDPRTAISVVAPLEDPDHVDERRKKMGLQPLGEYVVTWNIDWNVVQYKKELPELEKRLAGTWK